MATCPLVAPASAERCGSARTIRRPLLETQLAFTASGSSREAGCYGGSVFIAL